MNEAETRANRIDPLLTNAGWNIHDATQVGHEIPVAGYDAQPWNGFTDYCLYDASGVVLAVIEAKKASRNPCRGEERLRQYIGEIAKRQPVASFGFLSNGQSTYFWEVGVAHPRLVAGFFSPADLERKRFILQHGQPLEDALINPAIADRPCQHEAIRRVAEAFKAGLRRALLVMATGTASWSPSSSTFGTFLSPSGVTSRGKLRLRMEIIPFPRG